MNAFFMKLQAYGANIDEINERFLGDEELYNECFKMFLTDENLSQLNENLQAKKYKEAFNNAHTIKGVVGNLGLTPLFRIICVLVESLRHATYDHIDEEYLEVIKEFNRLKEMVL